MLITFNDIHLELKKIIIINPKFKIRRIWMILFFFIFEVFLKAIDNLNIFSFLYYLIIRKIIVKGKLLYENNLKS